MNETERTDALLRPDETEFATTSNGRDITRGYIDSLDYLVPQDEILRFRCRGDWRVYEELKRDDRVYSAWSQRVDAIVEHETQVDAGGQRPIDIEATDFIRETVGRLKWDEITKKMANGIFYGFAVAECIWSVAKTHVELADIRVKRQRRFRFAPDGSLKLLTSTSPDGEVVPERKFWVFATGADDDDEPYGLGLAHWLYWPCWFKRNGQKSWQEFLRRLGTPTPVGKYPVGSEPPERAKLLNAVRAIQEGSGIIVPEGTALDLLEAAKTAADYQSFYTAMDAAITRIVVKQTMTSDDGASYSQSQTHPSVRDQTVKSDADLICQSFNAGPVTWLTEWNFPGAAPPKVWRVMERGEDLTARAQREEIISRIGYRPTLQQVIETYGGKWDLMPQAAPTFGGSSFAEAPEPDPNEGLAPRLEDDAQPILSRMLESVREVVMTAKSLEEIPDRILELDLDADIEELAGIVREAMLASKLLGLAEVRGEAVKAAVR